MKILVLFVLLLSACSTQKIHQFELPSTLKESIKVKIVRKRGNNLLIEGKSQSCFVSWYYKNGIIKDHIYQCMLKLETAAPIMSEMLIKLTRYLKKPQEIKTLIIKSSNYSNYEQRVAYHAYTSNDWDWEKGQAVKVNSNKFIEDYTNGVNAHYEFTAALSKACFHSKVSKVDGAKGIAVVDLPFFPEIRHKNVKRRAKLPANYQLTMDLTPKHENCFTRH